MKEKVILYQHEDELEKIAKEILNFSDKNKIFAFYGELGAGKTTLIKAICKSFGVEDEISSPTFSIVNEYKAEDNKIYHFDFYRLKNEEEAYDIGYEEYFYSNNYCFIEWPEKIKNLLPLQYISVKIENKENFRTIIIHI